MRAITVEAKSIDSARALSNALSEFAPQLSGNDEEGYRVSVEVTGSDGQIVAILDALQEHVTERESGPARVEVDGRRYTMHADSP
jgi:hypothetical protein